jgi:hypothetical protein
MPTTAVGTDLLYAALTKSSMEEITLDQRAPSRHDDATSDVRHAARRGSMST